MPDKYAFIKPIIERATVRWPPRRAAMVAARRISQLADKRTKWEYQCNHCKDWFKSSQINLDHVVPKGKYSQALFSSWLDKCLCEKEGWQVLCIPCHKVKTAHEQATGAYK